jgi:hypothetical protein
MSITALEVARNAGAAVLDQVYFHGGVPAPESREEIGEHRLHVLRAAANPQCAGLSGPQRAGTLTYRIGVLQEPAAAPQQVLTFGCQLDPAANTIEQRNSELGLERLDLAGGGRLAQAQLSLSGGKAPGFRNDDECAQLPKIHIDAPYA